MSGEIPSTKIYEDEQCSAILDKFPATEGQALIIPKRHAEYIMQENDETYTHLFLVAKKVAHAIDSSLKPLRTCIVVEGFEVPHAHIRLHPAYEKKLLTQGKMEDDIHLRKTAEKIKKNL